MLTIKKKLNNALRYPIYKPHKIEDIIFFDIETTGFSAKTSYLYLIGCVYYENNSWNITQWLLENNNQEEELLHTFSNTLKSYKRIVHYNGNGFDIPFLAQKYEQYNIPSPFPKIESYDIYQKLMPFKKLFPFPNLKLTTVERNFGFNRDDSYSGGDLIKVYTDFVGRLKYEKLHIPDKNIISVKSSSQIDNFPKKDSLNTTSSKALANILLLHNLEDVVGLLEISKALTFIDFFQLNIKKEDVKIIENTLKDNFYQIHFHFPFSFPNSIKWTIPLKFNTDIPTQEDLDISVITNHNNLFINIPVYQGTLKYFYDNYKDYYYLPKEDMAIHKSVARYVDKDFRMKAKPANCYSNKSSIFIPILESNPFREKEIPVFLPAYNTKPEFIDTHYLSQSDQSSQFNIKDLLWMWLQSLIYFTTTNKNKKSINSEFFQK